MRGIINFCMKNKLAVWILIVIVVAAGLYSGMRMKLETIPNINIPVLSVVTTYPGASPDEVDEKVTKPIAQHVRSLPGVKVVSSTSRDSASVIQIEYSYKKDLDQAETEIKEALGQIKLPDEVEDPKVVKQDFNAFPVMAFSISGKHQSLADLTDRVENDILPAIEAIDGVSSVQISGQEIQEVDIDFNKQKLAQYGLSEDTVKGIIQGSAVKVPLGLKQFGQTEKTVVIDGDVTTIDDLKNLRIPVSVGAQQADSKHKAEIHNGATTNGATGAPFNGNGATTGTNGNSGVGPQTNGTMPEQTPSASQLAGQKPAVNGIPTVKLSDIATVKLVSKAESISRTNGKDAIGFQVVKAQDANTVDVVNQVKEELKKIEDEYKDLNIVTTFDQGQPIKESVDTMLNKAMFGAIFAALIILLFLRNIRTTLISVVSIPLSILIALLVLNQMGITLNIMTLGAMTVAIGRVVDDSIVVIENVYRRMSQPGEKLKGKALIREATREMFLPILSSTVVTVAVFLPLGFVQGAVGELFLPFALTIVFALAASLLIAITVVPMLTHTLFKRKAVKKTGSEGEPWRLARSYKKVLNWSLNHKLITFGMAILLLVGSLFLVPLIGVSFLPSDEQKMVIATFNPAVGESKQDAEKTAAMAEDFFLNRKGVHTVQYSLGGENPVNPGASNQALFFVEYDKDTPNFDQESERVIKELNRKTAKGEWGTLDMSSTSSNNLELYVYGNDEKDIKDAVKQVTHEMEKEKNLTDIDSGLARAYDQYTLVLNQAKLSQYGLTAGQVGASLSSVGGQNALTTLRIDGKDVNVYVQAKKGTYSDVDDLLDTKVTTPLGGSVKLADISDVKTGKAQETITRRDGKLYTSVQAKVKTNDVGKVSADLQKKIDKMDLPDGVSVEFGGVTQQINESFTQLGLAMLAAIAIVYFVLVVTFGNGLAPFAILFSLPFTVIGGFLALYLTGETISISAMIGALMLIGIVVANAIVLIDRTTRKQEEGLSTREALLEAAGTRLRPILMTAIATIGALLPLAFGMEGSGLISKGLGVTVIGGLASSTLLTLLIVPIVYEFLMKFRRKHPAADE